MKAAGCVGLALVLAFAGFLGLTAWLITRGDDQSGLTQRVDVTVLHPREVGTGSTSGYRFEYAYRVDGQWYGGDGYFVSDRVWSPGDPVAACLDPEDPRLHVVSIVEPCGKERGSANFIREATPRPAPEKAARR